MTGGKGGESGGRTTGRAKKPARRNIVWAGGKMRPGQVVGATAGQRRRYAGGVRGRG